MNAGDNSADDATEQHLAARLAAYDQLLKDGSSSPPAPETPTLASDAALSQYRRAQACVNLLEAVFPRATPTPPTERIAAFRKTAPQDVPVQLGRFVIRRELGRGGF